MSVSNLNEFNEAVLAFGEHVPESAAVIHRHYALQALRSVVLDTPVDSGRLRANWQQTLDAPAETVVATLDPTGTATLRRGERAIAAIKPFGTSFLSNNLPYAEVVENGGFVPANPENSPEANKKRAKRRSNPQRRDGRVRDAVARGLASTRGADAGVPFVANGYSLKAPKGMVAVNFARLAGLEPVS